MLEALDRLVEEEGIVEAVERLGVNYHTVAKCHESRHVSRRTREALRKYRREQGEEEGASAPGSDVTDEVEVLRL